MKHIFPLALLLSLVLINGCNSPKKFSAFQFPTDQFEPNKIHLFSSPIKIKGVKTFSPEWASFVVSYEGNSGEVQSNHLYDTWYLQTTYAADDWLFVDRLQFSIDGKVKTYWSSLNPSREVQTLLAVRILETNNFIVDEEFFHLIKSASKVSIRLTGKHNQIDGELTVDDLHNIGWFYDYAQSRKTKGK